MQQTGNHRLLDRNHGRPGGGIFSWNRYYHGNALFDYPDHSGFGIVYHFSLDPVSLKICFPGNCGGNIAYYSTSKFNDDGITALYHAIIEELNSGAAIELHPSLPKPDGKTSSSKTIVIPSERIRYLAEISSTVRGYHEKTAQQAKAVRQNNHLQQTAGLLKQKSGSNIDSLLALLKTESSEISQTIDKDTSDTLRNWEEIKQALGTDQNCCA